MRVEIVGKDREPAWDRMVAEHPYGSVFQTIPFMRVLAETFPQSRPIYLALVDRHGCVKGGIPFFLVRSWLTGTRLVSLPFVAYSDPLIGSSEDFQQLFDVVLDVYARERASYVEIKARESTGVLERCAEIRPRFYHRTYWIDLTQGLDRIWAGFHKTAIQQRIRRSQREGIAVRAAESERDVVSFYDMLVNTRRRLGVPPQNYVFFQKIWEYLAPAGTAVFLVAERRGEAIGGAVVFIHRRTLYVGYVASKQEYWALGVDQSLFWKALQIAIDKSCTVYDLGKTSPFAEGLVVYKKRWGARELETPCFYYPHPKGVSALNDERRLSHRVMTQMWRRLPGPVLRMGARFAYRHLG